MPTAARLIVASNRLPFTVQNEGGDLKLQASCGGLAAALGAVHQRCRNVWVGWPGDCETLNEAQRAQLDAWFHDERVIPVDVSRAETAAYYDGVCNSVLWPVFHYLLDCLPVAFPDFRMYRAINERFAEAIVGAYREGDVVWIHDYHLLLAPAMVRQQIPQAQIGFFLHTPFPVAEVFRVLPWRRELLEGVLGSTLLGFQTPRDARNFTETVEALTEYRVDNDIVVVDDREVRVGAYPIGVDPLRLHAQPDPCRGDAPVPLTGRKLLLGIDRLDYTKGIPRRLAAFERLLDENPGLHGEVELLQVAVPSRAHVPSYAALKREVDALVGSINRRYGSSEWTPVRYMGRSLDPADLGRIYRAADVMLVTSLRDGMNLVAKEFVLARNDEDGVLILSELAGAAEELGDALLINPYSVEDIAGAMATALTLDRDDRRRRMRALRGNVESRTVETWAELFTTDLMETLTSEAPACDHVQARIHAAIRSGGEVELILPYEGMLVPPSEYADALRPDPELIDLLRALSGRPGISVHVVSGLNREVLGGWLEQAPVTLWAEHGLWRREAGGSRWRRTQTVSTEWAADVRELFGQFAVRTPGAFVVERGTSLIWNFQRTERIHGRSQAQLLSALLREAGAALGFAVMETADSIEVRPAGLALERTIKKLLDTRARRGTAVFFQPSQMRVAVRNVLGPGDLIVGVGFCERSSDASVGDARAARALLWDLGTPAPSPLLHDLIPVAAGLSDVEQVAAV